MKIAIFQASLSLFIIKLESKLNVHGKGVFMYYIMNHTKQIIAIDTTLLEILGVLSSEALMQKMVLQEIHFNNDIEDRTQIITPQSDATYRSHISELSSIFGTLTLVRLDVLIFEEKKEIPHEEHDKEQNVAITTAPIIDPIVEEPIFITKQEKNIPTIETSVPIVSKEAIEEVTDEITIEETIIESPAKEVVEEPIIEISDTKPPLEEKIAPTQHPSSEPKELQNLQYNHPPILIDIHHLSKEIDVTPEDYTTFLNEYIDTALSLEKDITSESEEIRSSALNTLTYLANMLKLPIVNEIIQKLDTAPQSKHKEIMDDFYHALVRITIDSDTLKQKGTQPLKSTANPPDTTTPNATSKQEVEKTPTEIPHTPQQESSDLPVIDLDTIEMEPFSLEIEQIADTLQLPQLLVEGFIRDFISQIHLEKDALFLAYYAKDLATIQAKANDFKVISQNLQLDILTEKLSALTTINTMDEAKRDIISYWASFLSLENQIETLTAKAS